jgi:HB1, ASXL, restriction endonuclease HTH domain
MIILLTVAEQITAHAQLIRDLDVALQDARARMDLLQQIAETFGPDIVMMPSSSLPRRPDGTTLQHAQRALEKAGHPLHTTALAVAIHRHGGPLLKPGALRSAINKDLDHHGARSLFERVKPATYGLRAWRTPGG